MFHKNFMILRHSPSQTSCRISAGLSMLYVSNWPSKSMSVYSRPSCPQLESLVSKYRLGASEVVEEDEDEDVMVVGASS